MPRKPSVTFNDKELEIMRVVWELGEATVKQIQERLSGVRHYNSVLTIVRVLEQKGHLTYRVKGRAHVYSAKVHPDRARRRVLSHLVNQVFGGSAVTLVLNLVDAGSLTKQDLDDVRRRLAARKGGK
ncbi:MAG: BlaI/MecI/CopY family transcriptional regulator [Acidobacteriota bacterium]|nr:BlaI/MecI/CopY family transcriptional regulator [Acidobacteriota bacterium]